VEQIVHQAIQKAIKNRDVKFLTKHKFGYDIVPGEAEIIRKVAFRESKRINIRAMTRYGKSFSVTIGIALMIDMTKKTDKFIPKINFIGPKQEQAGILREFMTDLIFNDASLLSKAMLSSKGDERIIKEASRKKMTFNTGPMYRVFSAEGDANRIMGFGGNVIVKDEACLINRTADIKIARMLGDAPDDAMLIELMNPWDTDNKAYEHSLSEKFDVIKIDYKQALREGRVTQEHIDEMADECGGKYTLEFTVLYKSEFPEMSEDALFSVKWIKAAFETKFTLWYEVLKFRKAIELAEKLGSKSTVNKLKEKLKEYKIIISCDPADKGKDKTVIYWIVQHGNLYQKLGCYWEAKSDNQDIASKIYGIHEKIISTHWNIDGHGLGIGVVSRLKRIKRDLGLNVYVKSCLHGGKVLGKDKRKYKNQKAVNHFRLRRILKEGRFDLSEPTENKKLLSQAMKMKWERSISELIQIIDPGEKEADKTKKESPDFVHALEYAVWQDKGEISTAMVEV